MTLRPILSSNRAQVGANYACALLRSLRGAVLLAALLTLPSFATAQVQTDTPSPPAVSAEEVSLQGFGVANPTCLEWNDGCATCKRSGDFHCSTPGIACQPGAIICKAP